MNTVYNDIPPVIYNKSEESETFQCEERAREHKCGLRMRHYLSLITLQWHVEVKLDRQYVSSFSPTCTHLFCRRSRAAPVFSPHMLFSSCAIKSCSVVRG